MFRVHSLFMPEISTEAAVIQVINLTRKYIFMHLTFTKFNKSFTQLNRATRKRIPG